MKTLKDLFFNELADAYDSERRLVKAMPKMAKAAKSNALKQELLSHLNETEGHVEKLEMVFKSFGKKAKAITCEATKGLIKEADEILEEFKGSHSINAAVICAAQKVEHYEIASYGCLHEWAGLLGDKNAAGLLLEILEEEKAANESLILLARTQCNAEALKGSIQKISKTPAIKKSVNLRKGFRAMTPGRDHAQTTTR
jgi:ferritin-like metal-binding protein YciE